LIAIDKSGYKDKIIGYSLTLAKALGASITAIHVLDKSSFGMVGDLLSYYRGGNIAEYEIALKKQAEEFLNEVKLLVEKAGVRASIDVVISKSSAAEGIIDFAKEADADLIIIGTKGLTGVERFLMGGVATSVIRHAHCPVLAVR
jgi:nucleotide-binding universal stress UspA family protein